MRNFVRVASIVCVAVVIVCAGCNQAADVTEKKNAPMVLKGDYLGQTPPGDTPQLFSPGFISTGLYERDVAMTPEGDEFYFGLMSGGYTTICVTKRKGGVWTPPEIAAVNAYTPLSSPPSHGKSVMGINAIAYASMRLRVARSPKTMGSIGKPAAAYSRLRYSAMAQKCGGVQTKTIEKSKRPQMPSRPSTAASAINGVAAPAAPPMTMFCGVRGLSQMV